MIEPVLKGIFARRFYFCSVTARCDYLKFTHQTDLSLCLFVPSFSPTCTRFASSPHPSSLAPNKPKSWFSVALVDVSHVPSGASRSSRGSSCRPLVVVASSLLLSLSESPSIASQIFYNEEEAFKYATSSRMLDVQSRMSARCLELLMIPEGQSKLILGELLRTMYVCAQSVFFCELQRLPRRPSRC